MEFVCAMVIVVPDTVAFHVAENVGLDAPAAVNERDAYPVVPVGQFTAGWLAPFGLYVHDFWNPAPIARLTIHGVTVTPSTWVAIALLKQRST